MNDFNVNGSRGINSPSASTPKVGSATTSLALEAVGLREWGGIVVGRCMCRTFAVCIGGEDIVVLWPSFCS